MSDAPEPEAHHTERRSATYTAWLRALPDTELATLFAMRPDLISPVPADLAGLAARATSRPAVLRVLDRLDRLTLRVVEGLLALDGIGTEGSTAGVDTERLATALPVPRAELDEALRYLRAVALLWEDDGGLRPVAVLRDIIPHPAGLGPPLATALAHLPEEAIERLAASLGITTVESDTRMVGRIAGELGDPERLTELLASAGADARSVLERLTWGPPNGTISQARREVDVTTAASPIERLLARGLVIATDDGTVTLPREIGLFLRGGRLFNDGAEHPPKLSGPHRSPGTVDRTAAGQAFTTIRSIDELLESWAEEPPGVLRNGGLGVRDLRRSAQSLDLDETTAAILVEVAYSGGLIASGDVAGEWLPTVDSDSWRSSEPARRWLWIVRGWLRSARVPSLARGKDERGRSRNVLGEGLDRGIAPEVRADVLRALATAPPGVAPTREAVAEYLAWLRPRRQGTTFTEIVDATLDEARVLGVTGRDALAGYAQALVAELDGPAGARDAEGTESPVVAALAPLLPQPLDHILLQGDLTAVAPGPLVPALARELALAADVESTGGATVYRFTTESIRRALDAGRDPSELTELLETHSTTPLPQALRYLIDDVSRRHGRLRAGTAAGYLRCEDTVVLEELLSDRRARDLGLFRLAPTVLGSRMARPALLERLHELGYHPIAEANDGSVQPTRSEVRRAETPAATNLDGPTVADPELRMAAVRAIRAGDEAATTGRRPVAEPETAPPRSATTATLDALTSAAERGQRVWIGYLDTEGRASSRIVEPARVDGGYLTAYDATRASVQRFAVHRITGVADIDSPELSNHNG